MSDKSDIVKKAPTLARDVSRDLRLESKIERRIVWNLLAHLDAEGFKVTEVDDGDGDENVPCPDALAVMEAVFAVDESRLYVRKDGFDSHWIYLVGGNVEHIISDWSYFDGDPDGFNARMDAFDPEENW